MDSILEAVFTVSPKRQYLGIVRPTTPATQGPGGADVGGVRLLLKVSKQGKVGEVGQALKGRWMRWGGEVAFEGDTAEVAI